MHPSPSSSKRRRAFTLIELLISVTILAVLFVLVVTILSGVQRSWTQAGGSVSQFREARRAFDVIKFNLQQATLNTYERLRFPNPQDPFSPSFDSTTGSEIDINLNPLGYVRFSELHFITGRTSNVLSRVPNIGLSTHPGHCIFFQAPLGFSTQFRHLPTAINGRGYYVEFGNDNAFRPPFISSDSTKFRYRLMEYAPPTENNTIYQQSTDQPTDWIKNTAEWSRPIADNIVFFVVSPKILNLSDPNSDSRSIAPSYDYDTSGNPVTSDPNYTQQPSDYQLPPAIELLMVVIDESSAENLARRNNNSPPFNFFGFTSASDNQFQSDTRAIEVYLTSRKINFRIFSTTVPLRNSRWDG